MAEKKKAGRPKKTTHSSGMLRKRITIGHDKNGKPINPPIYAKTQAELEEKIGLARIEYGMGVSVTDKKGTWKQWANMWVKLSYPSMGKSTQDMYSAALNHLSAWNDVKINKLQPINLSVIAEQMYADGYSKRTIKSVISVARQVSKLARKNHAMMINLAEDVKPEKDASVKEVTAISPEEEELIWSVKPLPADNKMDERRAERLPLIRMWALMQLTCGPRREECAALEWKDVDLKDGILSINRAYCYAEKDFKGPKSKAGYRHIPMSERFVSELKTWKSKNSDSLLGRKYVFPGENGVVSAGQFRRLWDILIDAINGVTVSQRISVKRKRKGHIEQISLQHNFNSHQLRHTFATNCIAEGIDVRTVQYLMGHGTPQMTMKYADLSQAALSEVKEKINARDKRMAADESSKKA